jgi:HTH-type transcriptional regulator/antitoxin HipB
MRVGTVKDLGLVIRDGRQKLGMSQQALADRVGVSRQWIIEVEKGKPRASADLLLRALRTLGLELTVNLQSPGAAKSIGAADGFGGGTSDAGSWDVDIDALIERARGKK